LTFRHIIQRMVFPATKIVSAINEPTRKQRELLLREELIMDTAQAMVYEHGYSHLSMDRVAEATEFPARKTWFAHFVVAA